VFFSKARPVSIASCGGGRNADVRRGKPNPFVGVVWEASLRATTRHADRG